MKKNYINPITTIIDIDTEALMAVSPGNVTPNRDNTGASVYGSDITGQAGAGQEVDAAGYRSNLWND
ncbi:MAG: hypothetical protein IJS20_11605 [Bacteroidales bacterium]|nr:hypothetical protein [Bacteroidales bacterium]